MSDFETNLKAKAYALVGGSITLDEFKAWYIETVANPTKAIFGEPTIPMPKLAEPVERETFGDYASKPKANQLDEPDPEWTTGTGDRGR